MKLYLIRHGVTVANENWLYCGHMDSPLAETGKAELREKSRQPDYMALNGLLDHQNAGISVYTTGMTRTEETLQELFGDRPHQVLENMKEMNFGIFEGFAYETLKEDPVYVEWCSGDNYANIPPEGESGNQMIARVLDAFRDLEEKDEDALVICHGGPIAAIMAYLFPGEEKSRFDWQPNGGEGYLLTKEKGTWSYTKFPNT